ncbi:MAG: hypothetical protein IPN37_11150 [Betaproteobacteria bacterium]|nr:hypothetical protein [Betaproteobacteria bacterium]
MADAITTVARTMKPLGPTPKRVALGHRRLAIVDLSPQGAPADGVALPALRRRLQRRDPQPSGTALRARTLPWRGHSDTETLLAASAAGVSSEALPRLVGMFAIAVWDRETHSPDADPGPMGEKAPVLGTSSQRATWSSAPS